MALDLPLPKRLLVHSHWTVEKKKMSKSVGNVVDPFETMETYGPDAARYFLARAGGRFKYNVGMSCSTTRGNTIQRCLSDPLPLTKMVDWTSTQFVKHSTELMSVVGNLYSRITAKKMEKYLRSSPIPTIVELQGAVKEGEQVQGSELLVQLGGLRQRVQGHMENLVVADAVQEIVDALALVRLGWFPFAIL